MKISKIGCIRRIFLSVYLSFRGQSRVNLSRLFTDVRKQTNKIKQWQ